MDILETLPRQLTVLHHGSLGRIAVADAVHKGGWMNFSEKVYAVPIKGTITFTAPEWEGMQAILIPLHQCAVGAIETLMQQIITLPPGHGASLGYECNDAIVAWRIVIGAYSYMLAPPVSKVALGFTKGGEESSRCPERDGNGRFEFFFESDEDQA